MKRNLRSVIAAVLIVCSFFTASVVLPQENPLVSAAEAASSVKLNKTKATLYIGQSVQLKVKNTKKTVTWTSSDKKIATVDKTGNVKAKKAGTVTITAKAGTKKLTCKVTVKNAISVDKKTVKVKVKKSTKVTITYQLRNKMTWKIDNGLVASCKLDSSWNGKTIGLKITGKKAGKATITLTDHTTGEEVKIKVTVPKTGTEEEPAPEHVVTTSEVTQTQQISYETVIVEDDTRYEEDGDVVVQEGVNGSRTIVYTVTSTDGVETERVEKSNTVTAEPVDKIISRPTKKHAVTTAEETVEEVIAFETETVDDDTRYEDEGDTVTREGADGYKITVYTVTYTDGEETSRVVKSETTTYPVSRIVSHPTKKRTE